MKKTLYFRVDGDEGKKSGLGHIYRTLKIYNCLKKKFKESVNFVFLSKYNLGIKILRKKTREKVILWNNKNFKRFKILKNDFVIIDTLGIEKKLLKFFNKIKFENLISFDEINKDFRKGLIINGIFFAKKKLESTKKLTVYQGPKYIILDKKYSKKIKKLNKNKNCIISCGGADKKNFLYKITKILINYKFNKIFVIIGKGVKKNDKVLKLKDKKVKLVKNSENLKKYFDKAHLAIVSGGTVMFEAIASGIFTLVIKNYDHQKYAINFFKNKNNITYLGSLKSIENSQLFKKNIINFLSKKHILNKNFFKNTRLIDGNGLQRTKKILCQFIIRRKKNSK